MKSSSTLAAKGDNPQAEPSPLEREIDELARSGQLSPKGDNNMG